MAGAEHMRSPVGNHFCSARYVTYKSIDNDGCKYRVWGCTELGGASVSSHILSG